MSQPLVSVIVLSHNRKEETLMCLQSIAEQDYGPMEILVLDNASTDGSPEAITRAFPDVRMLYMPKNYGDFEGRDIAFKNTSGDYVLLVDNDAILTPGIVTHLVERMEREPEVALIEPRIIHPETGATFGCGPDVIETDHYRGNFISCAVLIRADVLREAGGFPHYLLAGAELHLTFRFLDLGYRILHLGDPCVYHLQSAKNRVPYNRLFLTARWRLWTYMIHVPGVLRPLAHLFWIPLLHAQKSVRFGHVLRGPVDAVRLFGLGLKGWVTGPWRVQRETLRRIDYLRLNLVTTPEQYEAIPTAKSYFAEQIRARITGKGIRRRSVPFLAPEPRQRAIHPSSGEAL